MVYSANTVPIPLPSTHVHVWRASTGLSPSGVQQAFSLLDSGERRRAEAFRLDAHRNAYIAAHAALRGILAQYIPSSPSEMRFKVGRHGKPLIEQCEENLNCHFNLSRTTDLVVVAVSRTEVGVDVEYVREIPELEAIAQTCFSQPEQAALRSAPDAKRLQSFFANWTRKEACVKAHGRGLSIPLSSFDTSMASGAGTPVRISAGDAAVWRLCNLELPLGYAGALASNPRACDVFYRDWV